MKFNVYPTSWGGGFLSDDKRKIPNPKDIMEKFFPGRAKYIPIANRDFEYITIDLSDQEIGFLIISCGFDVMVEPYTIPDQKDPQMFLAFDIQGGKFRQR